MHEKNKQRRYTDRDARRDRADGIYTFNKDLSWVISATETEEGVTVTYSDEINLKRIQRSQTTPTAQAGTRGVPACAAIREGLGVLRLGNDFALAVE